MKMRSNVENSSFLNSLNNGFAVTVTLVAPLKELTRSNSKSYMENLKS